jgi:signal-transduction protein with cAMP-binding, CBS, and nucleotidyltransferase domain
MATVTEVMATTLLTVEPTTGLVEAARQMEARNVGAVLVMADDRLVGILTERDILRAVAVGRVERAGVAESMTRHPETIDPSDSTAHAASLMIHGGFRHLPVVAEGGRPVGIVSIRDLVRVTLADETPRGA